MLYSVRIIRIPPVGECSSNCVTSSIIDDLSEKDGVFAIHPRHVDVGDGRTS